MQIFKPTSYSTTKAVFGRVFKRQGGGIRGLGTTLSMSNDMLLGMAVGGVAFLVMTKKGLIKLPA